MREQPLGVGDLTADASADPQRVSGYSMRGLQGRVIDGVGREIIRRGIAPGALVANEAELAKQFGVSRTSVREGMRVLAAKGLVDIRQKIGTRVRRPEQWNVFDADILRWHGEEGLGAAILRDLVEVRQIIEPQAARLAAGRATMDDLRRLAQSTQAMADAADNRSEYARADVEFHQAVYFATHNVLLRQFGALVADSMELSFSVQQEAAVTDGNFAEDAERHAAVFRAIDRGAGERAAEAMLDVVIDGKNALTAALGELDIGRHP